ncbi:MAG: pantetheine-phosphate adenylyltransferase [Chloroflexi bacterium]|nr:pantetheine-phosphate adenylyltransferase [Chloroflexota bacterium]
MPLRRAVFPGSFNPIHLGHVDLVRRASRVFDKVIVAVYEEPQGKPMLFSVEERRALVAEAIREFGNVEVASYRGLTVDYLKAVDAFILIRGLRVFSDFEFEFRMALANQRLAPDIEVVNFITGERYIHISSSTVREIAMLGGDVSSMVPPHVERALRKHYPT